MTISILRLAVGQTVARPFARASSVDEMADLIGYAVNFNEAKLAGASDYHAMKAAQGTMVSVEIGNIDSETPVYTLCGTKFFAFREL